LFAEEEGPARVAWLAGAFVCALVGTLLEFYTDSRPTIPGPPPATVEAAPAAPPPPRVWNIPAPVRSFTGRDDQLAALRHQLTARRRAALVPAAALYGMAGIGKTQLAPGRRGRGSATGHRAARGAVPGGAPDP
jgi:hypothetical protein